MNVFLAGGSGAIGMPLVRALVEEGHAVTALTRSATKVDSLRALGASVAIADALDRTALTAAVGTARPTHVIHQLTALSGGIPRRDSDLAPTNRLRIEGTGNLIEAAVLAGARRLVVGSFAPFSSDRPQDSPAPAATEAIRSMERQVLEASRTGRIAGVVLRYGLFYGANTPSTKVLIDLVRKRRLPVVSGDRSQLPFVHVDDAVAATVMALDRAPAGSTYEIVDDRPSSFTEFAEEIAHWTGSAAPWRLPAWILRLMAPYQARMNAVRLQLSNARAKEELGWQPLFPTVQDGIRAILDRKA